MNNHEALYSPTLTIAFISAVFGMLNFSSACLNLDAESIFAIGIIRMILGLLFFISALIQIFKGEIYGNINLVFSIIFGFFSGTNAVIAESEHFAYSLIQSQVFAIIQILAGCYLGLILPVMRKLPVYQWGAYACMAVALNLLGFGNILGIKALEYMAGYLNILFSFLSMYIGLRAIEEKLPKGYVAHQILYEHEPAHPHKHSFKNLLMEENAHEQQDEP